MLRCEIALRRHGEFRGKQKKLIWFHFASDKGNCIVSDRPSLLSINTNCGFTYNSSCNTVVEDHRKKTKKTISFAAKSWLLGLFEWLNVAWLSVVGIVCKVLVHSCDEMVRKVRSWTNRNRVWKQTLVGWLWVRFVSRWRQMGLASNAGSWFSWHISAKQQFLVDCLVPTVNTSLKLIRRYVWYVWITGAVIDSRALFFVSYSVTLLKRWKLILWKYWPRVTRG